MVQRNAQRATSNPPKDPLVDDIRALWDAGTTVPNIARRLHQPEKVVKHVLAHDNMPNAASDLIEAIELLHSIFVPAAEISRRVKIDPATTLYVIAHGRLPQRQLPLLWRDEPEAAPNYERGQ